MPPALDSPPIVAVDVAVIGGGPAGLMAAEAAALAGAGVALFDAMGSVGRKFLLAGRGGLNLAHAEPFERQLERYGAARAALEPLLRAFDGEALRAWALALGIETFVGSSGRVFPRGMKTSPLLRAWLGRLDSLGVRRHTRHRWQGWDEAGALLFDTPTGRRRVRARATVLALGGGSWARLGSDGAWVGLLRARGVAVAALRPANCGFDVAWSAHFRDRHAGQPVKSVVLSHGEGEARLVRPGEFVVTGTGVEGGAVYALAAGLREAIAREGEAWLDVDLVPGRSLEALVSALRAPRGRRSLAEHLRRRAGIEGVKAGLLRECLPPEGFAEPARLAAAIKRLRLRLLAPRPLDEAISSAGGVTLEALDAGLMLRTLPGVFCAGEMLDWEAPTGGYLLTASFATGRAAGTAAAAWAA